MPATATITRRGLLAAMAGMGLAAVTGCSESNRSTSSSSRLPNPADAPFDTVVVLMLENRSFDHLLGWLPGANGRQSGLQYPDLHQQAAPTFALGANTQACGDKDPAHDWQSMVKHYNGGKCDGWLQTQVTGDHFPIGYYERAQVPILATLAEHYTLFDAYHCSLMAATWPNRMYQLCAATDLDETQFFPGAGSPRPSNIQLSIFDRVTQAGLSAGYYHWGEPMTGLFKSKRYDGITYSIERFYTDVAAGRLPNVTFVEPDYTTISEFLGTSNDYHPHGDIEVGEAYVARIYDTLRAGPQWDRMVLVINFDESGGFYDHVAPPTVLDNNVNPNPGPHPNYSRLGFRVPCIAVGPFAPRKIETAGPYEHCSVLRMIEWRWGLKPMSARDANAKNLADALDFSRRRTAVELPPFNVPLKGPACKNPSVALA